MTTHKGEWKSMLAPLMGENKEIQKADYLMECAFFNIWENQQRATNHSDICRAKQMIPIILKEHVTGTQRKYILKYYVDGMNIREIAEFYGVGCPTVSRSINRGLKTIYDYLRFAIPWFFNAPMEKRYINNKNIRKRRKSCVTSS